VIFSQQREVWTANSATTVAKTIERLWARDFVHKVQVDVEQIWFAFCAANNMGIPNLFGESLSHCDLLWYRHMVRLP
jgi:hypothetical protein